MDRKRRPFNEVVFGWMNSVADLGEGPGGPAPPLFWIKKEEMTQGEMADRASKSRPPPPPLSSRSGSATGIPEGKQYWDNLTG